MSSVVLRSIASTEHQDLSRTGDDPLANVDADMRHVLDVWAAMEPRPIERCSAPEARAQPTLARALAQIVRDLPEEGGVSMELRLIPGAAGERKARVYAPAGAAAGRPLVLYFHGGGFVLGDLGAYEATPRALARRLGAVVVAVHYRQAPEHPFPAAHDDATAAWRWLLEHATALGGDPSRIALVGEDAGANLALNVAAWARDAGARLRHLGLISPMAAADFELASYRENAGSRPLGTDGVRWLYQQAVPDRAALDDPRLRLLERDLGGLPPTTLVLAGLDPLRSEGELLAGALRRSGVWVDTMTYEGVTHGFIALARVVNKAMFAQAQLLRNVGESFS